MTTIQGALLTMASPLTSSSKAISPLDDKHAAVEKLSQHLADLNSKFCDHFSNQLQQVFEATIPDFPRLERPQALLQRLEKSHVRNVDVVEVYASRNIFTVDNLPMNRQGRIARLFHSTRVAADVTLALKKEPPENLSTKFSPGNANLDPEQITSMPPVTKEQVQAKRDAIQALQQKLAAAKEQRDSLQRRVDELEIAQTLAGTLSKDPVSTSEQVQASVSTLMESVHGLVDCQTQGEEAVEQVKKRRLETEENDNDENESDGLVWGALSSSTKPNTVEELYQKERKRIQTTTEDLKFVHRMLVDDGDKH